MGVYQRSAVAPNSKKPRTRQEPPQPPQQLPPLPAVLAPMPISPLLQGFPPVPHVAQDPVAALQSYATGLLVDLDLDAEEELDGSRAYAAALKMLSLVRRRLRGVVDGLMWRCV